MHDNEGLKLLDIIGENNIDKLLQILIYHCVTCLDLL